MTVEEVGTGPAWRQFVDLGVSLATDRPGIGWFLTGQRRRLRTVEPPGQHAARLLARRGGQPVGRLTAHQQADGEGCFGFLAVAGPEDLDVVRALLVGAGRWLAERGCATLVGPLSWTASDEAGVLVAGHDEAPATGRAWTPWWYGPLLEAAGLEVADELCSYRLGVDAGTGPEVASLVPAAFALPPELERFADPALLLTDPETGGTVVAVPDVAGGLAADPAGPRLRGAWSSARRARTRAWAGCVVLAVDGPELVLIPGLCAAARRAGYAWVLSPWAPDDRNPVLRHRLYRAEISSLAEES